MTTPEEHLRRAATLRRQRRDAVRTTLVTLGHLHQGFVAAVADYADLVGAQRGVDAAVGLGPDASRSASRRQVSSVGLPLSADRHAMPMEVAQLLVDSQSVFFRAFSSRHSKSHRQQRQLKRLHRSLRNLLGGDDDTVPGIDEREVAEGNESKTRHQLPRHMAHAHRMHGSDDDAGSSVGSSTSRNSPFGEPRTTTVPDSSRQSGFGRDSTPAAQPRLVPFQALATGQGLADGVDGPRLVQCLLAPSMGSLSAVVRRVTLRKGLRRREQTGYGHFTGALRRSSRASVPDL